MKQKNKCRDGINFRPCGGGINFRPCRGGFHIRPEQGITLIALIITIIVMLILVAVTITVSLNGGLFNYARKAAKGTNEAMTNEQLLAQGIINGQTINEIVKEYTNNSKIGKIDGINVGDEVYWDSDMDGQEEIWYVLYNDSTYGCQIISSTVMGGYNNDENKKGIYNNVVKILNDYCKTFISNEEAAYVRSVGCDPLNGTTDELIDTTQKASEVFSEITYIGEYAPDLLAGDKNSYDIDTGAFYKDMKILKDKNLLGTESYLLASRYISIYNGVWSYVIYYSGSNCMVNDETYKLNPDGSESGIGLYGAVRPVVTLKKGTALNKVEK